MEKAKIKVSGCSRIRTHAEAWCRISGYLSSMAALGCNSLAAIKIAFAGNAAHMIKMHGDNLDRSHRGMSSYDESRLSENGMKQAFGTIQLFRSHGVALSVPSDRPWGMIEFHPRRSTSGYDNTPNLPSPRKSVKGDYWTSRIRRQTLPRSPARRRTARPGPYMRECVRRTSRCFLGMERMPVPPEPRSPRLAARNRPNGTP